MLRRFRSTTILCGLLAVGQAPGTMAQGTPDFARGYTLYGDVGLIEMPSAQSAPDGQIGLTFGGFDSQQRGTFTFQVTERLSGSFRYSRIDEFMGVGTDDTYDRSFDLRYRILDEGRYVPAVAVGLRDFIGTGLYTSEYVVATKTLSPNLRVTAGLGWGRLGSEGGFTNPLGAIDERFETRPANDFGEGGTIAGDLFFRGDAAVFGGVEYRFNDRFTALAEYSSDAYATETANGTYDHESPVNVALRYSPRPEYNFTLAYLNGNELSFGANFLLNPGDRPTYGGLDPAPLPVRVRENAAAAASWSEAQLPEATLGGALSQVFATEGIRLTGIEMQGRQVRVRYENTRFRSEAQAMGRVARALTQAMPDGVELFVLEPTRRGIPLSRTTIRRSDMEVLENEAGATSASLDRAVIADAAGGGATLTRVEDPRPRFQWGLLPYVGATVFNSNSPFAVDVGLELQAEYRLAPNLFLEGAVRKRLAGNRDEADEISPTNLPPVRSDAPIYLREGDPSLERLTLTHYGRPGTNLYSRVTLGYLERMYGGASAELLWKPVGSRLALGAEVNYAVKREYELGFGFQDYDIVTGHASAYYDFGNGFLGQVDVGQYLAGDVGATVTLDREFENGWRVGAYVTRTDASFEDFGEGSFDKGIRLTVPTDWILGTPSQQATSNTISSLARDGGARLNVDGRLYEVVRDGHRGDLEDTWGRFWR